MKPSPEVLGRVARLTAERTPAMTAFARELIAIPSPAGSEKSAIGRVADEMEALGYDRVRTDSFGNVVGTIGTGPRSILFDAHVDTVGVGDLREWSFDPFLGRDDPDAVYGLGASDDKGALAAMLYAGPIYRETTGRDDVAVHVVASVMESECEGLAYRALLNDDIVAPEWIVLGKSTDLSVCRGQRGRLEGRVTVRGRPAHAATPDEGVNVANRAARIVVALEQLNRDLPDDPFLGRGTITVTQIESTRRSTLYLTPDACSFTFDRRLTRGETRQDAIREIEAIAARVATDADVEITALRYDRPSYTGHLLEVERAYPQWQTDEDHPLVRGAVDVASAVLGRTVGTRGWSFSTHGVYTMGVAGIPTIGFGPGRERDGHRTDDRVPVDHLAACMQCYALLPLAMPTR